MPNPNANLERIAALAELDRVEAGARVEAGRFGGGAGPIDDAVAAHVSLSDPHAQYLKEADVDAAFVAAALTGGTAPTVSGSCGGNAALQSLVAALAGLGLITDTTTP
jgi:hypothetical protein